MFDILFRSEIISLRSDRDKLALEANFARERLDSFMKEFEHQVIILFEYFPHLSLCFSNHPSQWLCPIYYLSDML